ncbi:MAG TPA: GTPase [Acidimicrobiales bacterium]|nr:GTPase [Acidimicrobiales bacterium]
MSHVEISELHGEIERLREAVRDLLTSTDDPRCSGLSEELVDGLGEILSIALIGPYNAGKSSIVKTLAPNADVVIDANVATDRVVETLWHGVQVVDTPGIGAGRPAHDDMTERAIVSSDLLMFVVTAELFDATIADYFRSIVIDAARGGECILIVNKSTQDSGNQHEKLAHISAVLRPLSTDDLRVVFIDARTRLWAEDAADGDEREELLQLSNFAELTSEIDAFARRSGLRARLTTPVYQVIDVVDRGLESLGEDEGIQKRLDLLNSQRKILLRHRAELEETARSAISAAGADLVRIGQQVAAEVQAADDDQTLRLRVEEGQALAARRSDSLDNQLDNLIRAASHRLSDDLQGHVPPELKAGQTTGSARTASGPVEVPPGIRGARVSSHLASAEMQATLKNIATFFRDNSRPGQPAHAFVYEATKKLRIKHKPWGNVKLTRRIGKVAEGLGAALVVLEVVNEHREQRAERREGDRVRAIQQAVRSHFVTYANSVAVEAEVDATDYVEGSYNAALATIDSMSLQLVQQRRTTDSVSKELISRREELGALLTRIHAAELIESLQTEERGPEG